jgi:hypothetical protein
MVQQMDVHKGADRVALGEEMRRAELRTTTPLTPGAYAAQVRRA